MYHNVAVPPPGVRLPSLYVTPADFTRQMRLLRLLGLRGISMSEAMPYLTGERTGRSARSREYQSRSWSRRADTTWSGLRRI